MSDPFKLLKSLKQAFIEQEEREVQELFTSPCITVYDDTIYGYGTNWKESLKDALDTFKNEGYTLQEVSELSDEMFTYHVSESFIEAVKQYGSDVSFYTQGSKAYLVHECQETFFA